MTNQSSKHISEFVKQGLFEAEIMRFEAYLDSMESILDQMAHEASNREVKEFIDFAEDSAPGGEESEDDFLSYGGIMRLMVDSFCSLFRSSFFVSIYSFLETSLEKHAGGRIPPTPTNFLVRAEDYFRQTGIPFPIGSNEWVEIQNYRRLRNCIIHSRAQLRGHSSLRDWVRRTRGLRIVDEEVLLENEFCKDAYETVRTFLRQLYFGRP